MLGLIKVWEEPSQQIAVPEGFSKSLTIGAQYSLWPGLGFRWIDQLRADMPDLSLRAEIGIADRLTRFLTEGVVQVALTYTPQLRPGISVQKVLDTDLVLVAVWRDPSMDLRGRYDFADWGPEFVQAHSITLPMLTNPGMTFSLGSMLAPYIILRNFAAYLPARYVKRFINLGELNLVPDAPRFPYTVWSVWRDDMDPKVAEIAQSTLEVISRDAHTEQDDVMARLKKISRNHKVGILGA